MYEPQTYLHEDFGFPLAWIEVAGVYTAAFYHSTLALDFFGEAHGFWTVAPGLWTEAAGLWTGAAGLWTEAAGLWTVVPTLVIALVALWTEFAPVGVEVAAAGIQLPLPFLPELVPPPACSSSHSDQVSEP